MCLKVNETIQYIQRKKKIYNKIVIVSIQVLKVSRKQN